MKKEKKPLFKEIEDAPMHHKGHGEPQEQKKHGKAMIYCRNKDCQQFVVGVDIEDATKKWNAQIEKINKVSGY